MRSRLLTILLIMIPELRFFKKEGLTEKERRVFEVALPWWVANDLTWGIKGLSGGPGVGVNYTD